MVVVQGLIWHFVLQVYAVLPATDLLQDTLMDKYNLNIWFLFF